MHVKYASVLTSFVFLVVTVSLVNSEENSSPESLDTQPVSRRLNTKHLFNLVGRRNRSGDPTSADSVGREDSSTNENTVYPIFTIPKLQGSANVSDIEEDEKEEEENMTSILDHLETPEGVDENNPEEIARKEFYFHHKETFQQILEANRHVGADTTTEGDIKLDRSRNFGGKGKWSKTTSGVHRGQVRIPYKLSSSYSSAHTSEIRKAMLEFSKYTCIHFVPRTSEFSYLFLRNFGGCSSYVGRMGYPAQTVSIEAPKCIKKGVIMHELMHALGFHHEHSRSDRDQYVRIFNDNVAGDERKNLERINNTVNLVIYDYGSIMHYGKNAFSKKSYIPTMQVAPLRKPEPAIGQRKRLSPYDIEEIKYLYQCGEGSYSRCGRDFFGKRRGSFESPSYPRAYLKAAHCTWKISVRPGKFVKVTFQNVDIKDSVACQDDAIHAHDGPNAGSTRLRSVCGRHIENVEVTSTGRQMFIIFSTDSSNDTNIGFRAVFSEVNVPGVSKVSLATPTLAPITQTVRQFLCNFDADMCGMTQDALDSIDWLRNKGPTLTHRTGPTEDHTTGRGQYIFVESSLPTIAGDNAIIRSPWFQRKFRFCVSFSYHMYGYYMGGLRLYAYEKRTGSNYGHEKLLWEKYGNQGKQWNTLSLSYVPNRDVEYVQFYWETYVYYYQSDCALDDIIITPGNCSVSRISTTTRPAVVVWTTNLRAKPPTSSTIIMPTTIGHLSSSTTPKPTTTDSTISLSTKLSSLNCTFEVGMCGFEQYIADDFDWERISGETQSFSTGPNRDHTTGTGHYIYIEASPPRRPNHVARLISPKLTPSRHCLSMWYHMYGKQIRTLSVTQVVNGVSTKIIEKFGDHGNKWLQLTVDVNSESVYRPIRRRQDFVSNESQVAFNSTEFGEVRDQSSRMRDSQNYVQIIIEASVGKGYAGDIAVDDIFISGSACDAQSTTQAITTLKSTTAPRHTTQPTISTRPTTYTSSGRTTLKKVTTIRPAPPASQRPVLWSGMPLCTFENNRRSDNRLSRHGRIPGDSSLDSREYVYPRYLRNNVMCGWRQVASPRDQFNWTRVMGSEARDSGRRGNRAQKRGYHLHMEASSKQMNDSAFLQTYPMPSYDYCLDINYFMHGNFLGSLSVRAFERLTNGRYSSHVLHSVSGNQGNRWNNARINYCPRSTTVKQVTFELRGTVGKNRLKNIAIDDITILPGRCDACRNPTKRFVNDLNQEQTFSTGCAHTQLFWVRCCSLNKEKAIYRRVRNCDPDMFSPERLNWYCTFS